MTEDQISLPYFLAILVILGLIIRFLFFNGSSSNSNAQQGRSPEAMARAREAAVERIQQMFPQTERRNILWDLQRNGGNIQGTTERILSGRLETPPITFQPPPPPPSQTAFSTSATTRSQPEKPKQPDLITRYKLKDRLDSAAAESSDDASGKAWSSNREDRQASLQRRREKMVLAARRKMEAKIAAEKAAAGGS